MDSLALAGREAVVTSLVIYGAARISRFHQDRRTNDHLDSRLQSAPFWETIWTGPSDSSIEYLHPEGSIRHRSMVWGVVVWLCARGRGAIRWRWPCWAIGWTPQSPNQQRLLLRGVGEPTVATHFTGNHPNLIHSRTNLPGP